MTLPPSAAPAAPAALVPAPAHAVVPALSVTAEERARLADTIAASQAVNTTRAYDAAWREWSAWCAQREVPARPGSVDAVMVFMEELFSVHKRALATIELKLAAISKFHEAAGVPSPTRDRKVRIVLEGLRRQAVVAGRTAHPKDALLLVHVVAMLGAIGVKSTPIQIRDRLIILLGFASAMRRSELADIDLEHLSYQDEDHLLILLPKSKTNQHGELEVVSVARGENSNTCPLQALEAWQRMLGRMDGPLFRRIYRGGKISSARLTAHSIGEMVKKYALEADLGFEPADIGAHSLRAGHVTEADDRGVPLAHIADQLRHRNLNTTRRYLRHKDATKRGTAGKVGL